jgi:hypothetical protein
MSSKGLCQWPSLPGFRMSQGPSYARGLRREIGQVVARSQGRSNSVHSTRTRSQVDWHFAILQAHHPHLL